MDQRLNEKDFFKLKYINAFPIKILAVFFISQKKKLQPKVIDSQETLNSQNSQEKEQTAGFTPLDF